MVSGTGRCRLGWRGPVAATPQFPATSSLPANLDQFSVMNVSKIGKLIYFSALQTDSPYKLPGALQAAHILYEERRNSLQ